MKDSKTDDDKDHLEEDDESLRRCKKHAKHPKYSGDCGLEDWSRDVIDRPLHSILGLIAGFVLEVDVMVAEMCREVHTEANTHDEVDK